MAFLFEDVLYQVNDVVVNVVNVVYNVRADIEKSS